MKHFKHLKSGMSLIEVMIAIAILAMFGTSLFIMQQFLFERMAIAQRQLIANLHMQSELIVYQKNILKELFAQEGLVEKSLEEQKKDFINPDMTIGIHTKNIPVDVDKKDSAFKNFKNLHLIKAQAEQDEKEYGALYIFMYVPEVIKT
jgi:prepilin-type N-terminal cleavage/methylation domain-containing protein